jgi:hypothetical protein
MKHAAMSTPAVQRIALVLLTAGLCGCGSEDETVPSAPLPPPGPCTAIASFACRAWDPCRPDGPEQEFEFAARTPGAVGAISDSGGTVLHVYHVPIVRARIAVSAVEGLISGGLVGSATGNSPGDPFQFEGVIRIPTPLSSADRAFLISVQVVVLEESDFDFVRARIPDASVPAIRNHASVTAVEADTVICITPPEPARRRTGPRRSG